MNPTNSIIQVSPTSLFCDLAVKSFLAGVAIAVAALCNMLTFNATHPTLHFPVIGALLFVFGLAAVVGAGWKLFTGLAGYVDSIKGTLQLFLVVLVFNILGVIFVGWIGHYMSSYENIVIINADYLTSLRINQYEDCTWGLFLLSVLCGFIVMTAVKCAKENNNWLPLVFGIPTFVICGFPHCIADITYYALSGLECTGQLFLAWLVTVVGNFIGCNIPSLPERLIALIRIIK